MARICLRGAARGNNADSDDDQDGFSDADEVAAGTDPLDANSTPVPEPTTGLLHGFALLVLAWVRSRRATRQRH